MSEVCVEGKDSIKVNKYWVQVYVSVSSLLWFSGFG